MSDIGFLLSGDCPCGQFTHYQPAGEVKWFTCADVREGDIGMQLGEIAKANPAVPAQVIEFAGFWPLEGDFLANRFSRIPSNRKP